MILVACCLIAGAYQIYIGDALPGMLLFTAALFIVYGYFRYNAVYSAFQSLLKGDDKRAESLINSVKFPNLLAQSQKAYYFFAKGALEQNKVNLDAAEVFYMQALATGLRTTNDQAIVNLNLAKIYREKRLPALASEKIQQAIKLSHKPEVEEEIQKLKLMLES